MLNRWIVLTLPFLDQLCDIPFRQLPSLLEVGVANNANYEAFVHADIHDLPEGMKCSKCLLLVNRTVKVGTEQLCLSCRDRKLSLLTCGNTDLVPFQVPPMTSTPVNYITIIARLSGKTVLPGDGYSFLRSFVEINK